MYIHVGGLNGSIVRSERVGMCGMFWIDELSIDKNVNTGILVWLTP